MKTVLAKHVRYEYKWTAFFRQGILKTLEPLGVSWVILNYSSGILLVFISWTQIKTNSITICWLEAVKSTVIAKYFLNSGHTVEIYPDAMG